MRIQLLAQATFLITALSISTTADLRAQKLVFPWGCDAPGCAQNVYSNESNLAEYRNLVGSGQQNRAILPTTRTPYAYGWYGTKPSMHWYRQFGTSKSFTQWTKK